MEWLMILIESNYKKIVKRIIKNPNDQIGQANQP